MFSKLFGQVSRGAVRSFSTSEIRLKRYKVGILGAAGAIGQVISLLLKENPCVYKVSMYDPARHIKGVELDLSHVPKPGIVKGYGRNRLYESLECCDIVMICAAMPRRPNTTRNDMFGMNSTLTADMARATAKICPNALVLVLTNPINSMVPLTCEIFQQECVYNPNHIFGITYLDVMRAQVVAGNVIGCDPNCMRVPVIGGHSNASILPIFSVCKPKLPISEAEMKPMYEKVQTAGDQVVNAKQQKGSSLLSMAYSTVSFTDSLIRGLNCEPNVIETAFVPCDVKGTQYFALQFTLGGDGRAKNLPLPQLSKYEEELMAKAIAELKKNIRRGVNFAAKINPYSKENQNRLTKFPEKSTKKI